MENKDKPELFKCVKCKKEKKEEEGTYVLEGTAFCCKKCCDVSKPKGEDGKDENICEFC